MCFAVHYHKYGGVQTWQEAVFSSSVAWSRGPSMSFWSTYISQSNCYSAPGRQWAGQIFNSSLFIKKIPYTNLLPSKVSNKNRKTVVFHCCGRQGDKTFKKMEAVRRDKNKYTEIPKTN